MQRAAAFRRGLDVDRLSETIDASGKANLFDLGLANDLYTTLLGPVEALVKDKPSLLVVPSGTLTCWPSISSVTGSPVAIGGVPKSW